jgi:hypothetical protein
LMITERSYVHQGSSETMRNASGDCSDHVARALAIINLESCFLIGTYEW